MFEWLTKHNNYRHCIQQELFGNILRFWFWSCFFYFQRGSIYMPFIYFQRGFVYVPIRVLFISPYITLFIYHLFISQRGFTYVQHVATPQTGVLVIWSFLAPLVLYWIRFVLGIYEDLGSEAIYLFLKGFHLYATCCHTHITVFSLFWFFQGIWIENAVDLEHQSGTLLSLGRHRFGPSFSYCW